jgi:hypothetical protein
VILTFMMVECQTHLFTSLVVTLLCQQKQKLDST